MKLLRAIVESPYEPNDINVLWIDTSIDGVPVLRKYANGFWAYVSSSGTAFIVNVDTLPEASKQTLGKMYATPSQNPHEGDTTDEWLTVVSSDDEGNPVYSWEQIGQNPDLSQFITKSVNNLDNYYLKTQTFTQEEIIQRINESKNLVYLVVDELPQASSETLNSIYLVEDSQQEDVYDMYITQYENSTYSWINIGDTSIALSQYATKDELNTKADKDTDAVEGNIAAFDANGNPVDGGIPVGYINQLGQVVGKTAISPIVSGKYITLSDGVGEHIGAETESSTYSYMRIPVSEGDWVIVNGVGGGAPRLWGFIDSNEIILAVAAYGATGNNLKLIAPANTAEVIINTSDTSVPSYFVKKGSAQGQIGTLSELATTAKDNLVNAVNELNELTLTDSVAYAGGTTVGTSTIPDPSSNALYASLKIPVKSGEKYVVSSKGGSSIRLYYLYDGDGKLTRVASSSQDSRASHEVLTVGASEHTLIVNVLKDSTPYYVSHSYASDTIARHTAEIADLGGDITDLERDISTINGSISTINGNITDLDGKIDNKEVATSLVTWTANRYIKTTPEVVATSASNNVGSIDVEGKIYANFNFSVLKGGSYSKLGWYVADANGAVLLKSADYAKTDEVPATDVEIKLPSTAKTLYISWNAGLTDTKYTYFHDSIKDLYERVDSLEDKVNIENLEVMAYDAVKYNDADYSYTRMPYPNGSAMTNHIAFYYPNAIVIDTPVDANAVSRSLEFADNVAFSNSRVISLDLVTAQYSLTNLEGGKIYYWRVYKDSTVTAVLSSGLFKTDGHIRDLLIKANNNFDLTYIDNVRDIGGWPTCDGKRLRFGCIIRGNELNHVDDNVVTSYISQDGIDELEALGVGAELDLRGDDYLEESALGSDVAYEAIGVDLFFYRLNIYINPVANLLKFKACLQQIITWLSAGKGIYVHCAGGCDRTGFLCALIEGICGVSENDINHDYELSGRDRSREYYTIAGGSNYDGDFKFAIEYIKGLLEYNGNIYVYYRGNYYDPTANITSYTPVPISDATLLAALNALPFGTFKQCWRRLMKIGGVDMSERDMDKLEQLLCS